MPKLPMFFMFVLKKLDGSAGRRGKGEMLPLCWKPAFDLVRIIPGALTATAANDDPMLMDGPPNIELKFGTRLGFLNPAPYCRFYSLSSTKLVYLLNLLESIFDGAGIVKSSGIGMLKSSSSSISLRYSKFLREPLVAIWVP